MAAGPIGACWAPGSWSDSAWEAETWASAVTQAGSGQPLWPPWRQIRQLDRRAVDVHVVGVEARFSTGHLAVEVSIRPRRSVFSMARAEAGIIQIEALHQRTMDARVRQSVFAEATSAIGSISIRAQKHPTEEQVLALLAVDGLFSDAARGESR